MITILGEIEKTRFIAFEKRIQKQLNIFYQQMGWFMKRDSKKTHDLLEDSTIKIEEKIRTKIWADLAIEIIQDLHTADLGWFFKTEAVGLHYVMCEKGEPKILYRIHWPRFKKWYLNKFLPDNRYGKYIISPMGYGLTLNTLVPISKIPEDLFAEYYIQEQLELFSR